METTTACELFHRCLERRNAKEWREFHRRYHPKVRGAIRRAFIRGGSVLREPDLEEIVQDFYCRLLVSGRRFRGRSESELWSYLGALARNLALDHRRAARSRKRWLKAAAADPTVSCQYSGRSVSSEVSPEERCLLNDYRRIFLAGCRKVARDERAVSVLRLALLEGWSSREIAHRLGTTASRIDVMVCRLKRRLVKEGIRLPRRRDGCPTSVRRPRRGGDKGAP